jgi:AAA domain-containing protein/bifunctional DNA primase/polymerase-like protein
MWAVDTMNRVEVVDAMRTGETTNETTARETAHQRMLARAAERAEVLAAARAYLRRGWRVVPLRPGEKAPAAPHWPDLRLTEGELPVWYGPSVVAGYGVGLLLGEPSGGLVDVDCDTQEAALAAAELLPPTGRVSGRHGNPASHYWYVIADGEQGELPRTAKFTFTFGEGVGRGGQGGHGGQGGQGGQAAGWGEIPGMNAGDNPGGQGREWGEAAGPKARANPTGTDAGAAAGVAPALMPGSPPQYDAAPPTVPTALAPTMLLELRSTGCQTLAPPSRHPSGERARWERDGEPGRVDGRVLRRACARVAAAALLARHWPAAGARDEAALALAGFLLRGGLPADEADHFAQVVAKAADDEEWQKRGKAAQTARAIAEGRPVAGATKLAALLAGDGRRVVAQARAWLGLRDGRDGDADAHRRSTDDTGDQSRDVIACWPVDHLLSIPLWQVPEARIQWLWPGRIPLGTLTLLDGDPGLGKSLLTLDLIARVTTGQPMPDGAAGVDGGAVLLSAEDDLAATVRPRLRAACADLRRILAVQTVKTLDAETGRKHERSFALPDDIHLLDEAMAQVDAKLLVIDPLMAYLDPRINSWRDQDVRTALAPLARLAERTGAAVVILRHLTKGGGTNAIYRGGGSIGIIGAARSGLLVAKSPDDPEHERIITGTKSNLGPPLSSLRYRIAAGDDEMPRIEWLGESEYTAARLLSQEADGSSIEAAVDLLRDAVADGERPWTELEREANAAGISSSTLVRARKRLHLRKRFDGFGKMGRWMWSLPPVADENGGQDATDAQHAQQTITPPTDDHPTGMIACGTVDHLLDAGDHVDASNATSDGEGAPA